MVSLFWVGPFLFGQDEHRDKMNLEKGDVFVVENKEVFDCWRKDSSCFPLEYEIKQFIDLHHSVNFEISIVPSRIESLHSLVLMLHSELETLSLRQIFSTNDYSKQFNTSIW